MCSRGSAKSGDCPKSMHQCVAVCGCVQLCGSVVAVWWLCVVQCARHDRPLTNRGAKKAKEKIVAPPTSVGNFAETPRILESI